MSAALAEKPGPARRWLPLWVLLGMLAATLLPALNLGFASDDYESLVEDTLRLPLTLSFDGLHRPVRNILFKLSYRCFGLHPVPYHLAIVLLHLLAVVCLYRLMLRLGAGPWGATVAAALFGFFPRNHQTLFWISSGADVVVTICALAGCSAWLRFKETRRAQPFLWTLVLFLIALGFKETAVAILPLLALVDLTFGGRPMCFSLRDGWKIYLPLAVVAALHFLWVRDFFGSSAIPQHFYSVHGPIESVKMVLKFALNAILPFSRPLEVMHNPGLCLVALAVVLVIAGAAVALVEWRKLLLTAGWFCFGVAPTAVLGFYTDRYLCFGAIGLAMLLGFVVDAALTKAKRRRLWEIAFGFLLGLYLSAAVVRLSFYREQWQAAAAEIQRTMGEVHRLYPAIPPGSTVSFINLTRNLADGQVYVFNTGVRAMLLAWGYGDALRTDLTFKEDDDPHEAQLVRQLLGCGKSDAASRGSFVFVEDGELKDVSGDCATSLIQGRRERDPDMWK